MFTITRLPQELLLLLLLAGVCLMGFKFWEHRIRLDEGAKVEARMNKAWGMKLRAAEDHATGELLRLRKQHANEYRRLASHADALKRELQSRPTRTELEGRDHPHPLTAAACPVCTGARLAREDAQFLARESAAGAAQQLDLLSAIGAYDTCRRTLEEVTTTTGAQHDSAQKSPGIQP